MPEIIFDKDKDKESKVNMENLIEATKLPKSPTGEEMAEIAARHTPEQWEMFCKSPQFLDLICTNLPRAKCLIEKMLAGKGNTINEKNQ